MRFVGADLADVNQALDALVQLDECAEVHELGDGAFDLRADGELLRHIEPGVGQGLLEAERDAALLRLDGEDDGVDAVALLENVAGVANLLALGHLRDMNEAFDAGLNLDKCAEIGESGDGAGDALAGDEAVWRGLPGLGLELLEAERDLLDSGSILRMLTWSSWPTVRTSSGLATRAWEMSLTWSRPSMPPISMNAP